MIPDNYDAYVQYEREMYREERKRKREELEEEMEFTTVPNDYGTHKECYPNKEEK